MQRSYSVLAILIALAVVMTACSSQAGSTAASPYYSVPATQAPAGTQAPAPTVASGAAAPAAAAQVALGKSDQFGSFLVDAKGMSLYLYTKDSPNTSVCYDKCATAWPPLLTSGAPVGGDGLDASKFGTTTRTDGTTQVTYNSWPLYYFAKDKQPGDTTGQNVGNVWYLVAPSGEAIK